MWKAATSTALAVLLIASIPIAAQEPAPADWQRVVKLGPGQAMTVTVGDAAETDRYFVSADNVGITMLNLDDPALPRRVTNTLRRLASEHAEYLNLARRGTFVVDDLRMSAAGVFVGPVKVADLQRILETEPRTSVHEISITRKGRGFWGHLGPLGGYFIGGMTGGLAAGLACRAAQSPGSCDTGAFLVGMLAGGVGGGLYGFHAANRETEEIIYHAPVRLVP